MSSPCVLRMFGTLRLDVGAESLTRFPTRRSAYILARLALAKDHRIGRDELAEQLWPDDFLSSTRIRLRQDLSRLRHAIGELGVRLHADRQTVAIEPGCLTTDVRRFEACVAASQAESEPEGKARWLAQAVEFLDGPFMAGHQDPWVIANRRDYEEKARLAWLGLADAYEKRDLTKEALSATMNAVRHAPMDVEANACLVRRLLEQGQAAQARQAYFEFDAMMFRELGEHVPHSVWATVGNVLAGSDEEPPPEDLAFANPVRRPPPIYGRAEELSSIRTSLSQPGACVVLVGAVAVGKTHLLREAAWQFSQEQPLTVCLGDTTRAVDDGLVVLESPEEPARLRQLIQGQRENGWRVLARSRARLDVEGITEIRVNPLPAPAEASSAEEIRANSSVQILSSRVANRGPAGPDSSELASLAELARRLDGLPGALKVFSSRLLVQSAEQVLTSLADGLAEFSRSPVSHGEEIRSVLNRTLTELPPHICEVFLVSITLDGVSVELANTLAAPYDTAEVWRSLESRCLIVVEGHGPHRRYRVPAPISHVIRNSLTPEEQRQSAASTWRAVAEWALKISRLTTGPQAKWAFDCLQVELPNLLRGLSWAIDADPALAGQLVVGMWRTVCARGNPYADAELIHRGATVGASDLAPKLAGEMWTGTGKVLSLCGRLVEAESAFLAAIQIYESIGDTDGDAWASLNYATQVLARTDIRRATDIAKWAADNTSRPGDRGFALCQYALGLAELGETEAAVRVGEKVFAERLASKEPTNVGRAYGDLAELYRRVGRPEAARPLLIESVRRLRDTGVQDFLLEAMANLARTGLDLPETRPLLDEAQTLAEKIGSNLQTLEIARMRMANAARTGDREGAVRALEDTLRYTKISQSAGEREASFRRLAEVLERFDRPEYANAVRGALGEATDGTMHEGWRVLLSSESHLALCVLAEGMSREALGRA